jgi:hypothetical protein
MKRPGISETKRCIIAIDIEFKGEVVQVAAKLPQEVERITGVYFSIKDTGIHTGTISLRFSEGISNSLLNQRVTNQHNKRRKIKYLPLCEPVTDTCTLQGYYRDTSSTDSSYTMLIYLEYIPRKRENLPHHERAICS